MLAEPTSILPPEILKVIRRKSSRDPVARFSNKLHMLLGFAGNDRDRQESLGLGWIDDNQFRINKKRLIITMEIKLNTLNVNLKEAEKLIRHALSVDAKNPAYLDSLAWVLFRQGKFEEAEAEIRRAIRFAMPGVELGTIYWHAGEIAAARGKRDEARRFLLMALADRDRELDRDAVKKRLAELESNE